MDAMRGFFLVAIVLLILNIIMGGFAIPNDVSDKVEGDCNNVTQMDQCLDTTQNGTDCYWCKAGAVPSGCYTQAQSKRLPSPVFVCTNGSDILNL